MSLIADLKAAEAKITAVAAYIPLVNSTVQTIEAAMPGSSGQSKFQAALASILAVAHAGETVPNATVQLISSLIDTVVSMLNGLNIFKKASPVTSVTVPAVVVPQAT